MLRSSWESSRRRMNQTNPQLSFKSTPDVWPDEKGGNHPFSISRESKLVTFWWKSVAAAALSAPTCLKVNWDKLTAENADKGPAVWFVMKASRGVATGFFWAQASFLESGQQWVWKLVVITFSKADAERLRLIKRELWLTSDYYKSD